MYHKLPELYSIFAQTWERIQTGVGWRRRGRMPVFPGLELDNAVFIDYLIQTQEAAGEQPWQLEITPLETVNLEKQLTSWQQAMAGLVNTALDNDIDLIRISVSYDDGMVLSWHSRVTQEWQETALYGALKEEQKYMGQWLENSWHDHSPVGLYSSLESAALSCVQDKLTSKEAVCQPLAGITTHNADTHTYRLTDAGAEPAYIHISNNPSWIVVGEPGYLTITPTPYMLLAQRADSQQYRMSHSVAAFSSSIIYTTIRNRMNRTLEKEMDAAIQRWRTEVRTY